MTKLLERLDASSELDVCADAARMIRDLRWRYNRLLSEIRRRHPGDFEDLEPHHPFGFALEEMDVQTFLNMRDWLRDACAAKGGKMVGGGVGMGQADIDIELEGCSYNISIKPLPK